MTVAPKKRAAKKASFSDLNTAIRMMRAIRKRVRKEIDIMRPDYVYAIVDSINTQGNTVMVYYPESPTNTFKVHAGTTMPLHPGQRVRIAGRAGDRYIDDIPDGVTSDIPPGMLIAWSSAAAIPDGWLQADGSAFDGTQYGELALVFPGLALPNPTAPFTGGIWLVKY